jgi:hypothetical protein
MAEKKIRPERTMEIPAALDYGLFPPCLWDGRVFIGRFQTLRVWLSSCAPSERVKAIRHISTPLKTAKNLINRLVAEYLPCCPIRPHFYLNRFSHFGPDEIAVFVSDAASIRRNSGRGVF